MSRIVCGINPVNEALRARPQEVEVVHYTAGEKQKLRHILDRSKKNRIKVLEEKKDRLDELAGDVKHQGIVAIISDFIYTDIQGILAEWKKSGSKAFILVLDGIQDPHNLGAIIRSAESAGIQGIIIPKDRAVGVTSTVEKVSAGAVEHVKIARVTNIARTLDDLKKAGLWIAGAEADGKQSIYDADFDMDVALVIGSEGKGIRSLVKKKCDLLLSIPMKGKVNSLNASVSAAVVMYEVLRQRLKRD